jgi:hypothetical protein
VLRQNAEVDAGREDDSASIGSRRELVQADVGVTKRLAGLRVGNRDADAGRRGFEDEIACLIEMGCDLDPTLGVDDDWEATQFRSCFGVMPQDRAG